MQKDLFIYSDDEMLIDDRIYSDNPKDWDEITDLGGNYAGYFDLPTVYTDLRGMLPVKKETLFFLDGLFISARPDENPADIYLKYLNKKEANKQYYEQWKKISSDATSYNLQYKSWEPKIHTKDPTFVKDAVTTAIEKITPIFLMILQKNIKTKKLSKEALYSAYKQAICNNKETESYLSFERFTSDLFFAKQVANWEYAPKIAHLIKNDHLKAELRNRLRNKLKQHKVRQSAKWYKKYNAYKLKNKNAKKDEVYNLKLSGFFQDIDAMQSDNEVENFTILKKDLFNPRSDYNIKALINAATNKDMISLLHVKENITISSQGKNYKIAFGYKDNKKTGKMLFANGQKYSKDDSVYSISDNSFHYLAKWQRKLRLNAVNMNNEKSR